MKSTRSHSSLFLIFLVLTPRIYTTFGKKNNNNTNNNKQICIASQGRNFRGAGARQRVSKQRKNRKHGKRGMSFAQTATESLLRTVFGSEFQTVGAEHRKALEESHAA